MNRILLFICGVFACYSVRAVLPGIEHFSAYASLVKGKKIGIVANQTSVVADGQGAGYMHTVDFLRDKEVNIIRIFCPEHGFRGDADAGEKIGDYMDKTTGLPVVSLYGKKKKPLPEDLNGLEVVIFDMQDVGVRFYTYLSTLHYVMEACAEHHIPLVLMDRPNPNGFYIDGPVLDMKYKSFIGMHPVPIVYGMTIGEYAQMINGEGWLKDGIKCRLTVVPCRGWQREMAVELPRKPSPNLPDKISVLLYPSVCLFEGTVVSEGRGTYTPFQVFGHPDLKNMSYTFIPCSIPGMSKTPKCEGQKCYGMNLSSQYEKVKQEGHLHLNWLLDAYRNYTGKKPFFIPFFEKLAGTEKLRQAIEAGKSEEEIRLGWQPQLEKFKQVREKYLIY